MKPSKNLRNRMAGQSGTPQSGAGGVFGNTELSRLIEAERAKIRDAGPAEGTKGTAARAGLHSGHAPRLGPTKNSGSGVKGGKSTTNKGLRGG